MKLYPTTIYDSQTGETILAGIFFTIFGAEEQARVWVEGVTNHQAKVIDRDVNRETSEETIYYRANEDSYTAYINIYTLDEQSY